MVKIKQFIIITLLVLVAPICSAQLGFSHEVGIITGPVSFQGDFGERNNLENDQGNTGVGIGLIHYINFAYRADCNCYTTDNYFNDHFKLRTELSWNKTTLNHFGTYVDADETSDAADRLRGHSGVANNFDIGMQIEYYPLSIRRFQAFGYRVAPFVSFGAHLTSYNPEVKTTYVSKNPLNPNTVGDINDPRNFYKGWEPGSVSSESGTTLSIVGSIGARYKINVMSDFIVDLRFQYFNNNWVDGLNHQLDGNKFNDWLTWFNVGYIYYLD